MEHTEVVSCTEKSGSTRYPKSACSENLQG